MSVFTGGKKWGRRAKQLRLEAAQAQEDLEDLNFGRELLSNIRQQRLAASQLRMIEGGASDVTTTAHQGQMANINSGLASDYGYSVDVSNRAQAIERMQETATRYEKKAAKMDKRAGMAAMGVAAAASVITGGAALAFLPAIGAIGAMGVAAAAGSAATGVISATGGGRAAVAGGIQGTIQGTSLIGSLGAAGVGAGSSAAGTAGTVTEASGATTSVSFASEAGTATSTFTEVSPTIVSSAGTYGERLKAASDFYSMYNTATSPLRGLPKRSYYDDNQNNRGYRA